MEKSLMEIFNEIAKKYMDDNGVDDDILYLKLAMFSNTPFGFDVTQFSSFLDNMLMAVAKALGYDTPAELCKCREECECDDECETDVFCNCSGECFEELKCRQVCDRCIKICSCIEDEFDYKYLYKTLEILRKHHRDLLEKLVDDCVAEVVSKHYEKYREAKAEYKKCINYCTGKLDESFAYCEEEYCFEERKKAQEQRNEIIKNIERCVVQHLKDEQVLEQIRSALR